MGIKDDSLEDSYEATGVATYSNNKSIASSYASIFENLWTQTELYQKLKEADKIKDEFINVRSSRITVPLYNQYLDWLMFFATNYNMEN